MTWVSLFSKLGLGGIVATGMAAPLAAHPHVFIDTTVTAILDESGQVTAIRLRWEYDGLVSMVVVEDRGADADGDGQISPAEAVLLDGFDMTWIEGFDGDTSVVQADTALPLEPGPQDWATGWTATEDGGHLWSEHTRRLVAPVDPGEGPISVLVYDRSDYTAYALSGAVVRPGDPAGRAPTGCGIAPVSEAAVEEEGGLFSTLGLFVFGRDDGVVVEAVVPPPAPGRVIVVLSCD